MKTMTKLGVALLAVGVLIAGAEGVALADHNKPNLGTTGNSGGSPDYNYPMDTTQPGWIHSVQGKASVGYRSDYSATPGSTDWSPLGSGETGVSAAP